MKLDFCCVCGVTEDLQQHHIVPVIISGNSRKKNDETITVCSQHHKIIHGVKSSKQDYHNHLVKEGLQKARKNGVILGRPTTIDVKLINKILDMQKNGIGVRETCRRLKIGPATYYKVINNSQGVVERIKTTEEKRIHLAELERNPPNFLDLYS
jgi:hypothetical protein